ncbi:hypothetical protein IAU60_004850 [Kwoniella sp. DSM 27419]
MPRHTLHPLSRAFKPFGGGHGRDGARRSDEGMWDKLDRVQVLGEEDGHRGCVNALSWSDDGQTLLSGSDDTRICIWHPDPHPSSSSSSTSPHPLKLADTIQTGHRANIFSAKFLPNANTPTIVSVAGDRDVRVTYVERLARDPGSGELNGASLGAGVTALHCHRDRTKRIATENSPYLFLTVSEDGTVRQHDLRRPHECRSECPDALFYAPRGVDLYSLSVSTVTPHIFAVAGRTDCAYICDRRMLPRQKPSWGHHVKSSGQVHCVRRLGLPDGEWEKVSPSRNSRVYNDERHITCVKMSPEHADEVAVAFARHSTSLFSTFDSPPSATMRSPSISPTIIPSNREVKTSFPRSGLRSPGSPRPAPPASFIPASDLPERPAYQPKVDDGDDPRVEERQTAAHAKRRHSPPSSGQSPDGSPSTSRQRTSSPAHAEQNASSTDEGQVWPFGNPEHPARPDMLRQAMLSGEEDVDIDDIRDSLQDTGVSRPDPIGEQLPLSSRYDARDFLYDPEAENVETRPSTLPVYAEDLSLSDLEEMALDMIAEDGDLADDDDNDDDDDMEDDDDDDNDMGNSAGENDEDDEDADLDEDDMMDEDDFDGPDADDEQLDTDLLGYGSTNASRLEREAFDDVELVMPRRSFKGARNVETVKDCNFLGTRADKVCSGSDDGNFFVWDKDTGRLEGIWEGDGSVVNVMEQHPTLPLIAVSGIDNTVKMFAPTAQRPEPSFARTHRAETIIDRNTRLPRFLSGGAFERAQLVQYLMSRGFLANVGPADGSGAEGGGGSGVQAEDQGEIPDCQTQ